MFAHYERTSLPSYFILTPKRKKMYFILAGRDVSEGYGIKMYDSIDNDSMIND